MSAFFFPRPFPACLFSFVRGSDISLPPRILLRRRASCFQPRAFVSCPCPVNVLSVSSQPLLNLLSVSSQPPHIVSMLECIASTHTSSLGVLSAHRRIAVARVGHCMPSSCPPTLEASRRAFRLRLMSPRVSRDRRVTVSLPQRCRSGGHNRWAAAQRRRRSSSPSCLVHTLDPRHGCCCEELASRRPSVSTARPPSALHRKVPDLGFM